MKKQWECIIIGMRIHGKCQGCGKRISVYIFYNTRADYDKEKGKFISIKCRSCQRQFDYHLNNLYAIQSPFINIIFVIMFMVSLYICFSFWDYWGRTYYFYYIAGGVMFIPIAFWGVMFRENSEKVKLFNRNRIKE